MSRHKIPAAYHGEGWRPRKGSLAQDIASGKFWRKCSVNSEWALLRDVVLYLPDPDTPPVEDVNTIQHLEPINYYLLAKQMEHLVKCYEQLGITVHLIKPVILSDTRPTEYYYNLMYVRDLFFMTPEGAIIARMASMVRAGEEKHIARTLAELEIPIIRTISGTGTFEGANALWARDDLVLIGVGNRTNEEGFRQVKHCLEIQGVKCVKIYLPSQIQHLLGVLQIVDHDLAVIRGRLLSPKIKDYLQGLGFKLLELDETDSVRWRQAMNFVTISPRRIVMVAGNPVIKHIYEDNGIEIAAEVEVSQLLKGAGGIGCATGILNRDPI